LHLPNRKETTKWKQEKQRERRIHNSDEGKEMGREWGDTPLQLPFRRAAGLEMYCTPTHLLYFNVLHGWLIQNDSFMNDSFWMRGNREKGSEFQRRKEEKEESKVQQSEVLEGSNLPGKIDR
jgi:hypothetical protein